VQFLQGIRISAGGIKRYGCGNDGYNEFVQVLCYGLQVGGFLKKNIGMGFCGVL